MKKYLLSVAALAGLLTVPALPAAAQTVSLNAAVTNNYVWRGITQSDEEFAVQGGADLDFGNGLAIGTWASSVDFNDDTSMELDVYGSYSGTFGMDSPFGYTVGVIGYFYPDQPDFADYNFVEIYGGLSAVLGPATATGRLYYSPDLGGQHTFYWTGGIAVPFATFFTASANVGHYDYEFSDGYTDYNVGLAATWQFLTASLTYTGTDIDGADEYLVGMLQVKFPLGN
jgi:uncharacterized protein (TIGR02001 family)